MLPHYSPLRPHQVIGHQSPIEYSPEEKGEIMKIPILSGLYHIYFRQAAKRICFFHRTPSVVELGSTIQSRAYIRKKPPIRWLFSYIRPAGFEPATGGLEIRSSIQLS